MNGWMDVDVFLWNLPVLCSLSFAYEQFLITNAVAAHPMDSQLTAMVCYALQGCSHSEMREAETHQNV